MDKILELLKKLGIELTADQTAQVKEVLGKEFVAADEAAKTAAKVEELTKQLAERDKDLENLKSENKSEDLSKQLDELKAKYSEATEKLAAQETDYAAEKLLSGYKFASERVKNSVLAEFKAKGFKFENGAFIGGKEYLEELKKNEPDAFAKDAPGLFTDSMQGNVSADANNLETQIFSGFGLKNN
ncbi:MAG: phage scaffolding protein [Lachnospiraceae bacterium]|nr:phage scaffolding protein [Lachnospiraceae bacterium]